MGSNTRPKVYLAASAADIDRAKSWRERLAKAGVHVFADWIDNVVKVGSSNPRGATKTQRMSWAAQDLKDVGSVDLLWMLVPATEPPGKATRGAWVEAGYMYAMAKVLVFSGDTKQSIFCALGIEHESDEDAFREILSLLSLSRPE